MQYRKDKNGSEVSALGFGCMRLPKDNKELSKKLIVTAIDAGINYFDTAYLYPGNEELMGEMLSGGLRDKVKIATKLPPAYCKSGKDFDKLFYTELSRLKTDRVDYYLMHSLFDLAVWQRLCRYGIREWIAEKKKSGEIINIGFSYHGATVDFKKLIDDYAWDFCQIQYNYLDENNQAGLDGLNYAFEKHIPVVIMEPLRGGKLTGGLPDKAKELLKNQNKNAADIGLRWVWNHPGVMTVLSGMNEEAQLLENLKSVENALPNGLPEEDRETVEEIKRIFNEFSVIPCTGCGYCMPCPFGVSIPSCFSARNSFEFSKSNGKKKLFKLNPARGMYAQSTGLMGISSGAASKCQKCGACEKKCPQHIEIRKHLEETANVLEPWWFSFSMTVARKFNSRK